MPSVDAVGSDIPTAIGGGAVNATLTEIVLNATASVRWSCCVTRKSVTV